MAPRRVAGHMPAPVRVKSTRLDKSHLVDLDLEAPPTPGEVGSGFSFDDFLDGYSDGKVFMPEDYDRIQRYKKMLDSDGKASSVEKLLTYPIMSAPWEIKGVAGDNGEAEWIREFFDASYENGGMMTPITEIIAQMNLGQTMSRCYFEKVPEIRERDEAFIFRKIAWRPQETCELVLNAQNSEIIGFRQQPVNVYGPEMQPRQKVDKDGYVPILGHRSFIYTHGRWRDPIDGFSAMNIAYKCWETKRKIWYFWTQFLETTALPKTLVRNNDLEQAIADARKIATLRNRDVVGLNMETEVAAYESSGNGAQQFVQAMQLCDSEISNSVLGGFMDLTSSAASGKGSYALSADQSTLFLRTRRFVATDMARQITRGIIAPLIRWNFGKDASIPQFTFGPLDQANTDKVLELFGQLQTSTQATKLPAGFMEQITIRTANILELDPTRLQKEFDEIARQHENDPVQQIAGSLALATQLVEKKQAEVNMEATMAQTEAAKAAATAPAGAGEPTMNDPNVPKPPKGGSGSNGSANRPVRRSKPGQKSAQKLGGESRRPTAERKSAS